MSLNPPPPQRFDFSVQANIAQPQSFDVAPRGFNPQTATLVAEQSIGSHGRVTTFFDNRLNANDNRLNANAHRSSRVESSFGSHRGVTTFFDNRLNANGSNSYSEEFRVRSPQAVPPSPQAVPPSPQAVPPPEVNPMRPLLQTTSTEEWYESLGIGEPTVWTGRRRRGRSATDRLGLPLPGLDDLADLVPYESFLALPGGAGNAEQLLQMKDQLYDQYQRIVARDGLRAGYDFWLGLQE